MRRLLAVLLLCLSVLGVLAAAPPAKASSRQLSIMMDDNLLLYRFDAQRDFALQRMKDLGVDYARVSILWSVVAENARERNPDFRGADPHTYPPGNWDRYDRLVRSAQRIGVHLYFDVTGPGPSWAHGQAPASVPEKYRDTWKPRIGAFGDFVKAVGRRYDGAFNDENDDGAVLPAVRFWSIYNEPNQGGWLTPQYQHRIPWSPVMYRDLWHAGRQALDATGHKRDTVLIGETAPLGNSSHNVASPIYPKRFIREFFCLDSHYHRYRGKAARRRHCGTLKRIGRFDYTAWAHHPYTKHLAPTKRAHNRQAITIANISSLSGLLEHVKRHRKLPRHTRVALTEFGYETNPPDPFSGISAARQARYINLGDQLAYRRKRVMANTQFLLRDIEPVPGYPDGDKRHWFTYQSGLYYNDGTPKLAALAYRLPFVVGRSRHGRTPLWGQVRSAPAHTRVKVQLEFRRAGKEAWVPVGDTMTTNGTGFFRARRTQRGPGSWRARLSGSMIFSREVRVR